MADIRPGTAADVAGLRALGEAVIPATYDPIDPEHAAMILDVWWSVDQIADQVQRIPHVVAEEDGRIVGMANLGRRDDRWVIWKLYVHPDRQRDGLGGRLLAATEELVDGDAVWLEHAAGNDKAAAFYRKHGFVEIERVPSPPQPVGVWMRKNLA